MRKLLFLYPRAGQMGIVYERPIVLDERRAGVAIGASSGTAPSAARVQGLRRFMVVGTQTTPRRARQAPM